MCVHWNFPPDLGRGCHNPALLTRCLLCLLSLLRHEILSSFHQIFEELCLLPAHTHICAQTISPSVEGRARKNIPQSECGGTLKDCVRQRRQFFCKNTVDAMISLVLRHRTQGSSSCLDTGTRDTLVPQSEARWITSGFGNYFR